MPMDSEADFVATNAIRRWIAIIVVSAATATIFAPANAQQVVVLVNGAPITTYDVEQRTKLLQMMSQKNQSRQEIIDDLINDKLKIAEGRRYGLEAADTEVDKYITGLGSQNGLNLAQFTQVLASRGIAIETLKSRVRADLTWSQLVRGRFPSTLQVQDKDISEALQGKNVESSGASYNYRLRPIIFLIPKGSPNSLVEARMREAEGLRTRFQNCNEGIALARGLRDVAVRDVVARTSADLAPALREILNKTEVGQLTKPEVTAQGIEVFALCERTDNTTDTPEKRGARQELISSRFAAQSKRYLNEVRRGAMIEYK